MRIVNRGYIKACLLAGMSWLWLSASAISENIKIQGDHGQLDAIVQTPMMEHGQKVSMAIICHGFTGNKNEKLLTNIADSLEKRGIASIRFDFNGHGKSEGEFINMTVPNELVDASKVYEYVKSLDYVDNIFIIGHSQGGVVAAMTAGNLGEKELAAAVLLAPAAVLRDDALRGSTMGAFFDPYNPPDSIPFMGGKKILGGNYIRTATDLPIYETAVKYQGPLCVIHGNYDRVVPYTYGKRFCDANKNSVWHLLAGADHVFSNHENEVAHLVAVYLNSKKKASGISKSSKSKTEISTAGTEELGGGYSRDDKHAYYNGHIISTAQGGKNFTYKGGYYATDGVNTYYKGKIVDRD